MSTFTWQCLFKKIVSSPCVRTSVVWLHNFIYWFRDNVMRNALESMPLSKEFKLQQRLIKRQALSNIVLKRYFTLLKRLGAVEVICTTVCTQRNCCHAQECLLRIQTAEIKCKSFTYNIPVSLIVDPWMNLPESNMFYTLSQAQF